MRRLLIVNPMASGVTAHLLERVTAELEIGGALETARTERPGHAAELAREACRTCEEIYVFAGDGTYNEVVNGMTADLRIGFVPGGGTSVLPRALGLPRDPVACARHVAVSTRTRTISLGRANFSLTDPKRHIPATHPRTGSPPGSPTERRFTFSAGVGLDAELVRAVDARGRRGGRRAGDLAFIGEAVRLLAARRGRLEPALEVEGHGRCAFVVVANCDPYSYAGPFAVHAAPLARFELGLDLAGPVSLGPAGIARIVWWALVRPSHPKSPDVVYVHDADRLSIRCDAPMPLQLDGEDVGDVAEMVLAAERGVLRVIV